MDLKPSDFNPIVNGLNTVINAGNIILIISIGLGTTSVIALTVWGVKKILSFFNNAKLGTISDADYTGYSQFMADDSYYLQNSVPDVDEKKKYREWFKKEYGKYPKEVELPEDCVIDL